MKNITKTLWLLSAALIGAAKVNAQKTTSASSPGVTFIAGADNGITSGDASNFHRYVLGGSFEADISTVDHVFLTVSAAYLNFFHKDNVFGTGESTTDAHILPVKAGVKYFPLTRLFVQAEAGAGFALNKTDLNYDKTIALVYAPQVGYEFPLNDKSGLLAAIRYEGSSHYLDNSSGYSKLNYFDLKLAYYFR